MVSLNADTAGRVLQYSERRGLITVRGMATATSPAERDSLFRAAEAATRSTMLDLDYVADRALLANSGGGQPEQAVLASVAEVADLPRLGNPGERMKRVQQLCGVALGAPVRAGVSAVSSKHGNRRFLQGTTSGRTRLSERVAAVWVLDADTGSVRVRALFLIRGDSGWLRNGVASRSPVMYPPMPEAHGALSGTRVDTVWLRLDRASNIAWVHTQKVALADGNNVIFVDHGDGKGGPLTVTRVTRTTEVIDLGIEMAHIPDAIRGVVVSLPGWIDFFAGR